MPTRLRFLSSTLISALLAATLVACGGSDSNLTATFATASGLHRAAAAIAASGEVADNLASYAMYAADDAHQRGDDDCATSILVGTTLTVELEPCGDDRGTISGQLVVHGYNGTEDAAARVEVNGLRIEVDGNESVNDGDIAFTRSGATAIVDSDLSMRNKTDSAELGLSIDSRLSTTDGITSADRESRVTIDGVGIARIDGSWSIDRASTDRKRAGWLSVVGADTLRIDFDRPTGPDCYSAAVDGAAVEPICVGPRVED